MLAATLLPAGLSVSCSSSSTSSAKATGSFTGANGSEFSYESSFGSPTTKAGKDGCPPAPDPGTVNLPFTITLTNTTAGQAAQVPTIRAYSNILTDGTVRVPSPDLENELSGGKGLTELLPVGFVESISGESCSSDTTGATGPSPAAGALEPGKSVTLHGYIRDVPEQIPPGASVLIGIGEDLLLSSRPEALWSIHYGKQLENPPLASTTTTSTSTSSTTTTMPEETTTTTVASQHPPPRQQIRGSSSLSVTATRCRSMRPSPVPRSRSEFRPDSNRRMSK